MAVYSDRGETPEGEFYYAGGKRVPLIREPRAFAVKYRPQARTVEGALPGSIERLLSDDAVQQDFVPAYGLKVFVASGAGELKFSTASAADEQLARLNATPGIEYATPVYRQTPESRTPMYATNRILMRFRAEVSEEERVELHAELGGEVVEKLDYVADGYLVSVSGERAGAVVSIANAYAQSPLTLWAHPDFIRTMAIKGADKAYPLDLEKSRTERDTIEAAPRVTAEDWHVRLARVNEAWTTTRGRSDVRICVIDDGVDTGHAEFGGRIVWQFDYSRFTSDGTPKHSSDNHGTCCASVATAAGRRAFGAAPSCSLMAVRMGRFASSDEARMFSEVADAGADVISCSWGPTDGDGPFPLPDVTREAIDYCVERGRDGKGIPVFFAAGNGNELVSGDGYASYRRVMAIAASTSEDTRAPYSDFGPEIWIAAPSNGGSRSIFAADRRGSAGYNPAEGGPSDTDYFDRFGGTSSATPLAAGTAALMISANPALTERRVRELLATTAVRIGSSSDYDAAGHSALYGYGRLDAAAAVTAAQNEVGSVSSGRPAITGPASASRTGPAPSFQIDTAGRAMYAVEITARADLFDAARNGTQRTTSNFYASWETGLSTTSPFRMPDDAWSRLRSADALFYRVHVADNSSWQNHDVSTADNNAASAPRMTITASGTSGGSGGEVSSEPSIDGPQSISRSSPSPTFTINKGGRVMYAVEIATRAELFNNAQHGSDRTDMNFYASWMEGLSTAIPFQMPQAAWDRLKQNDRIWYRLHVADDSSWSNYDVTTSDSEAASAKSIAILGTGNGGGTGTGGHAQPASVVYSSGMSFDTVTPPADGRFDDPVGGGRVPLINVRGKSFHRLSPNFRVSEFLSGSPPFARISTDLVRGLQAMRSALGASIVIDRGYSQPPGEGADDWHVAGLAARISSNRAQPLRLAELALQHIGGGVSLGLGAQTLALDMRPDPVVWVEPGAAMGADEFEAFVAEHGGTRGPRDGLPVMGAEGPESVNVGDPPPDIYVESGSARFVAVEFATDPALFFDPEKRTPDTFHATWTTGLVEAPRRRCVITPDPRAWERLTGAPAVYYRAVGATANTTRWEGFATSLRESDADRAPRIKVRGVAMHANPVALDFLREEDRRKAAEALWARE